MLLYLTVKPNQRQNRIERLEGGWVVRIAAPATDGKANEEVVRFMAEILECPKSHVRLVKGHTARVKCLEIPMEKAAADVLLEKAAG